jgi:heme/copper-type cytochrome/quinol oxidase subunit 3
VTAIGWTGGVNATSGRRGSEEVSRWAMTLFLINEGTLFACLVSSYFYLALANPTWPPAGVEKPSLPIPAVMTALLLSSSGVLAIAERGFAAGRRLRYRIGVLVTVALGVAFLVLQGVEYADKLQRLGPSQNSYASLFFTITGLHGAHVAFGLLFLLWALLRETRNTARPPKSLAISNASWYWHFVDGVWLVIVTSLYLSPRWS